MAGRGVGLPGAEKYVTYDGVDAEGRPNGWQGLCTHIRDEVTESARSAYRYYCTKLEGIVALNFLMYRFACTNFGCTSYLILQ